MTLLPCPFCGNADEPIIAPWSNPNEAPGFMAVCTAASAHNGCGASTGWMPTEASAARVWNYRANATEIAQLRASLATAQADRDNLLANNEKLGDLISSMDQQITTLVAERDQMKENWDGAAGTCSRLHKALAVAERENATLRAELATMRESRDAAVRLWNDCGEELATAQADRDNLLARIHRDGGHYLAEHGATKAVADADRIVAELFTAQAALKVRQAAIDELVACRKLWAMSGNAASSAKYHTRMPLAWQTARALATPANPPANPPKEE